MKKLNHKFVEFIPELLDDDVLYVSVVHGTAVHRCCCGCGREVVTPLTPGDWRLTFDGETVSLYPSIGNWNFPCRSHYWLTRNRVEWAPSWDEEAEGIDDAKFINTPTHSDAVTRPGLWQGIKQRWWKWRS